MELRYRVLPSLPGPDPGPTTGGAAETDHGLDVTVSVGPGATIADLAEALATALGRVGESASGVAAPAALSVTRDGGDGPAPHPDEPVQRAAPRCGSTVRLVAAPSGSCPRPPLAPVRLVHALDPDGRHGRLAYGRNALRPGRSGGLDVTHGDDAGAAAVVEVDGTVTVRTTGHGGRVELDGEAVLGAATLRHGQLLRVGSAVASLAVEGGLHPPGDGPLRAHDGRAREWPEPADVPDHDDPVVVPPPPGRRRTPEFPWLSAAVPLGLGAGLWVTTGNLAVAGFVVASVAFVVAAALESRRAARREHRDQVRVHGRRLETAVRQAADRAAAWRDRSRRAHPGGAAVAAATHRPRWSRHGPAVDLVVRVGVTSSRAPVPVRLPDGGADGADDRTVAAVTDALEGPADVLVDLSRHRVLAIVGDDAAVDALARSAVVELAGLVPPDQLWIGASCGARRGPAWEWIDWLPHAGCPPRGVAAVVVVDGDDERSRAAGLDHLASGRAALLWLAGTDRGVPRSTTALVRCTPTSEPVRSRAAPDPRPADRSPSPSTWAAELLVGGAPPLGFAPDSVPHRDATAAARRWSAYQPVDLAGLTTPRQPTLTDLFGGVDELVDPVRIQQRWARHHGPDGEPSLAAPVGTSDGGVVVVDLAVDGPHALVAGTTGSGKSELLRTWLLATALCHPPTALNLLLVDYKGGTAFAELDRLPHSVGLVTDLDDRLGERVVRSLHAELRRRERAERSGGSAPPALVVAVDEFATLARELPAFVDGVVDVAQRGRSLGIHLLLATQRPAGVVTDAIRANTTLRIAMRVADEDDSRDVVGTVDAARIDRRRPGSALVRIGSAAARPVQVGWCGGPPEADAPRVRVEPLHGGADQQRERRPDRNDGEPRPVTGPTQLALAVRGARDAARLLDLPPPRRPWLPPPPTVVPLGQVAPPSPERDGRPPREVAVGLVDRPERQAVLPLLVDLHRAGGLLVVGPPGSGRSTALATVAAAACRRDPVRVHAVDRDGTLRRLLPDGCDVVDHDDADRTLRLLRSLRSGRQHPRSGILLFDDADDWCRRHERTNRGSAVDLLVDLCTHGRSLGVLVVLSTRRRADLPLAATTAIGERLSLGIDGDRTAPGRGTVGGRLVQVAVPPATWPVAATTTTPPFPDLVDPAGLPRPRSTVLPVGVDADRLQPVSIDLRDRHLLVLGPPRSGRSSLLRLLADQARRAGPGPDVVTLSGRDPTVGGAAGTAASRVRRLLERPPAPGRPGLLLVVDDLDELLDLTLGDGATGGVPGAGEFDGLLVEVLRRSDAVRVVAAASVDGVTRSFAEAPRLLRAGRHGVLLTCDPDVHPSLLHAVVPRRDEVPLRAGRGWLVGAGDPVLVQFARPVGPD